MDVTSLKPKNSVFERLKLQCLIQLRRWSHAVCFHRIIGHPRVAEYRWLSLNQMDLKWSKGFCCLDAFFEKSFPRHKTFGAMGQHLVEKKIGSNRWSTNSNTAWPSPCGLFQARNLTVFWDPNQIARFLGGEDIWSASGGSWTGNLVGPWHRLAKAFVVVSSHLLCTFWAVHNKVLLLWGYRDKMR